MLSAAVLGLLLAAEGADGSGSGAAYRTVVSAPAARDGSFRVGASEATHQAGAAGDPGRALENAPGVGRLTPSSDGLAIWGSTPAEGRVLFDGMEIPALFHFGAWRSVLPAEGLRRMTLSPAAFDASQGRAVGSVVSLESANVPMDTGRLWIASDFLDSSAGAIASGERGGLLVAGRWSTVDAFAPHLLSSEQRALIPVPRYRDLFVKTSVSIDHTATLTVEALAAWDSRDLALPASSFMQALSDQRERDFTRVAVRYLDASPWESTTVLLWAGRDHANLEQQLGLVPLSSEQTSWRVGLRMARSQFWGRQRLEWGLDGSLEISSQSRQGSLTNPPREGDLTVFGVPPAAAIGHDSWHPVLANLAPYVTGELHWGRWGFRPGLRVDGFFVSGDRTRPATGNTPRVGFSRADGYFSPRASANFAATSWLILGASAGIQRQAPEAADLSPVFGSPWLGAARARVAAVSATVVHRLATAEVNAFARRLDNLAVRNPDPWPGLAHSLVSQGRGRAHGVSVSLRHDCPVSGLCASLSYTLSRAQRRGPGDADWRLFDLDQTHLLSSSLGYRGRVWFAGARLRYATGMPRTPVTGAYFDTNAGLYRPILGAQNSERLPDFVEIDLRVEHTWSWPRLALTLGLEALNLSNRKNAEEIIYSGDFTRRATITGLPALALLSVKVVL